MTARTLIALVLRSLFTTLASINCRCWAMERRGSKVNTMTSQILFNVIASISIFQTHAIGLPPF